jgi:hypothetical protein
MGGYPGLYNHLLGGDVGAVMKRRGYAIAVGAVVLFIAACIWFGEQHAGLGSGVALSFVTHATNQSGTQATFRLYNDGPRAIFLSWMIVETNSASGWRVAERIEPQNPRVVDGGKYRDLLVSVPTEPGRWRFRVVYGRENRGPALFMMRVQFAIRDRSVSGWRSVGAFTGRHSAVLEVSQ